MALIYDRSLPELDSILKDLRRVKIFLCWWGKKQSLVTGSCTHCQARVKTCHISDLNRLIVMVRNQRLGSRLFQVHFTCLRKVKKVSNSGTEQNAAKRSLGLSRNLFSVTNERKDCNRGITDFHILKMFFSTEFYIKSWYHCSYTVRLKIPTIALCWIGKNLSHVLPKLPFTVMNSVHFQKNVCLH